MRLALSVVAVCATGVAALGFGAGVLAGRMTAETPPAAVAQADPVRDRFSMQQLGTLSGRLLRLESDAQNLVRKVGLLDSIEKKLNGLRAGEVGVTPKSGAAGGRLLPARKCGAGRDASLDSAAVDVRCLEDMLALVDAAARERTVALLAVPAQLPVDDRETGSPFGNRVDPINGRVAFHSGLDFPAPTGTPIHAAGGGTVRFAGFMSEFGNMVEIDHGNGLTTRYAHASKLLVRTGDAVTPRQVIAQVGSTGRSTGAHLHFEILHQGRYVDPAQYLTLAGDMSAL
ncbi:M23 family metallopeptidase [Uliginosibacterium sp. sgz301328]|uniref:M23 family metallopeptidase n=1 Tax=Uliginosibacterium sp. sgz301328 TaxID=3243764 RepID=UPI00359E3005